MGTWYRDAGITYRLPYPTLCPSHSICPFIAFPLTMFLWYGIILVERWKQMKTNEMTETDKLVDLADALARVYYNKAKFSRNHGFTASARLMTRFAAGMNGWAEWLVSNPDADHTRAKGCIVRLARQTVTIHK